MVGLLKAADKMLIRRQELSIPTARFRPNLFAQGFATLRRTLSAAGMRTAGTPSNTTASFSEFEVCLGYQTPAFRDGRRAVRTRYSEGRDPCSER